MFVDNIAIKDIRPGLKNINVVFIVLEVGAATVTKENREVRTFKVGDPTACINVSVWDEPGKLLVPGDIVRLTKGYASVWRHCLTLYSGKNGDIHKIGDFCLNFNEQLNMSEPNPQFAMNHMANPMMNNGTTSNNGASGQVRPPPPVAPVQPINSNETQSKSSGGQSTAVTGRSTGEPPKSSASSLTPTTSKATVRGGRSSQRR